MTIYNFDKIIDRRNTNSVKHDFAAENGLPEDVLPLWVADMDFRAPEPVLSALHRAADHGIFGYSDVKNGYYEAVSAWFRENFGWETKPEWLVKTPGVVFALCMAVRALTKPGDCVLVQPPVYYPFFSSVQNNGRNIVESPLVYRAGRYEIDFTDFQRKVEENGVKLFILCSPHNPVGRVWTREELEKIGAICEKYGVYVISDEIHCDFTLPGHPHTVFPLAAPALAEKTVVCTAPSKTFNLAGLQASNIWIPGEDTRRRFREELDRSGAGLLNTMGLIACQTAYESGGEWLDQCRAYLRGNLDCVRAFLAQRVPKIRLVEPEGTYFAWLDCSALGLTNDGLNDFIVQKAKLWLDAGGIFGGGAGQFQRVVLACPRATLLKALERLEAAAAGL